MRHCLVVPAHSIEVSLHRCAKCFAVAEHVVSDARLATSLFFAKMSVGHWRMTAVSYKYEVFCTVCHDHKKHSIDYYTIFGHTFSSIDNLYPSPTRFGTFQCAIIRD